MKKGTRKIFIIVIVYLVISSMYIGVCIDSKDPIIYENLIYESYEVENVIRFIMGLPEIYAGYKGVPPSYIIQIIIKVVIALILIIYLFFDDIRYKKNLKVKDSNNGKNILKVISKIMLYTNSIFIYLFYLYIIYLEIHC